MEEIDPGNYIRPPIFDVGSAVTVGVALITAMPKPAPDHVRAAAAKVLKDTVALQLVWGKSGLGGAAPDRRKADMRIDNAWGILLDRLESYSLLPVANHPRAPRARELLDDTPLSVEEVAAESGFGAAPLLRHHFARVVGITTSEYRRRFVDRVDVQ